MRAKENRHKNSAGSHSSNHGTNSASSTNDMEPEPSTGSFGFPTVSTTTTPSGGIPSLGTPMSNVSLNAVGNFEFSLGRLQEADGIMLGNFLTNPQDIQVRPLDFGHSMLQQPDTNRQLVDICEKELHLAVQYVKRCPFIGELPIDDQVALVKCGEFIFLLQRVRRCA